MERISIEDLDFESLDGVKTCWLEVFSLFDGSPISLPCGIVSRGEGDRVCIMSGQHGNEWNGIYASQKFFEQISSKDIEGTVIILPVVNPLAFNERSRVSSIDNIDLNRTFMNETRNKPTKYLGRLLLENIFSEVDFTVDLHTGGPGEYSPHVGVPVEEKVELASRLLFNDVIVGACSSGSLEEASTNYGFTNLTVEAGFQRNLNYVYIDEILDGLDNFLKSLDILEGHSNVGSFSVYYNKEVLPSPLSGFFKPSVELGDYVEKGEKIGVVEEFFDGGESVEAPATGKVLYLRREDVVGRGENLVHIANEDKDACD